MPLKSLFMRTLKSLIWVLYRRGGALQERWRSTREVSCNASEEPLHANPIPSEEEGGKKGGGEGG